MKLFQKVVMLICVCSSSLVAVGLTINNFYQHKKSNFETFNNFLIDADKDGQDYLNTVARSSGIDFFGIKTYYGSIALNYDVAKTIVNNIKNITDTNNKLTQNFEGAFEETLSFDAKNTITLVGFKGQINENVNDMFANASITYYTWRGGYYDSAFWWGSLPIELTNKIVKNLTQQKAKIAKLFNYKNTGKMQYSGVSNVTVFVDKWRFTNTLKEDKGYANIKFNPDYNSRQTPFPVDSYTAFVSMLGSNDDHQNLVWINSYVNFKNKDFSITDIKKTSFKDVDYISDLNSSDVIKEITNFWNRSALENHDQKILDVWKNNFCFVDENGKSINKKLIDLKFSDVQSMNIDEGIYMKATFIENNISKTITLRTNPIFRDGFKINSQSKSSYLKFIDKNFSFSNPQFNNKNLAITMKNILGLQQHNLELHAAA